MIIHCLWLVLHNSFRPKQGSHLTPFCLANALGITTSLLLQVTAIVIIFVNFHLGIRAVGNPYAIYGQTAGMHFDSKQDFWWNSTLLGVWKCDHMFFQV